MDNVVSPYGVSGAQSRILRYIRDQKKPIYQKDIERAFCQRRSSVSEMVKGLEKQGFLVRESVEGDARLKKMVLTPKALELIDSVKKVMDDNEVLLHSALSEAEFETFVDCCYKMRLKIEESGY